MRLPTTIVFMPRECRVNCLDWDFDTAAAMAAWRTDVPMLALVSCAEGGPFDRWTILARASMSTSFTSDSDPNASSLMAAMRRWAEPGPKATSPSGEPLPFAGGWIGYIGYEYGHALEPRSCESIDRATEASPNHWPDAGLFRVESALLYCHAQTRWYEVGDPTVESASECVDPDAARAFSSAGLPATQADPLAPLSDTSDYREAVARAIEFVRAGDIFQANISHPFHSTLHGHARHLAIDSLARIGPRYGAYLELGTHRSILSFSPELFLSVDGASRTAVTRPMKGTRPAHADEPALAMSDKDAAELHMIVDLMRNDLGRVCEIGSVRVSAPRLIERHPTVLQAVAEVSGTIPAHRDAVDLFAACFPPGSVTGAPKVRAMQVIRKLERTRRGPYCGAIGMMSSCGNAAFSVAIRTATLNRVSDAKWTIGYRAGCGIVAESDPETETQECITKTRVLEEALGVATAHTCEPNATH